MISLLWFLIVPVAVTLMIYAAVSIYRRYKDNQLEVVSDIVDEFIGDEWRVPGEEIERIFDTTAKLKWKELLKEERSKYTKIEQINLRGDTYLDLSESDDVKSHNDAYDRMEQYLTGKQVKTAYLGEQNIDFLSTIGRKKVEEKRGLYAVHAGTTGEALVPVEYGPLQDFLKKNKWSIETVVDILTKEKSREWNPTPKEKTSLAEQIRKNAAEKAVKEAKTEFAKQLKEVLAKVEDEQFVFKTTIEERDKEIERLRSNLAELKPVFTVSVDGAAGSIGTTTGKRKPAKKSSKRK